MYNIRKEIGDGDHGLTEIELTTRILVIVLDRCGRVPEDG